MIYYKFYPLNELSKGETARVGLDAMATCISTGWTPGFLKALITIMACRGFHVCLSRRSTLIALRTEKYKEVLVHDSSGRNKPVFVAGSESRAQTQLAKTQSISSVTTCSTVRGPVSGSFSRTTELLQQSLSDSLEHYL